MKELKEKIHQTSFLTGNIFRLSIHLIGVHLIILSKFLPYPHNQTNSLFLRGNQFLNWKLMVQTFKNTSWLQNKGITIIRLTQLKLVKTSLCWEGSIFSSLTSKPTKPLLTKIKVLRKDLKNEFANHPLDLSLTKLYSPISKMMAPTMMALYHRTVDAI